MRVIYKILSETLWQEALAAGSFAGALVDLADGYIHFSDASQVHVTASKHFAGQDDLLLVALAADTLGPDLKWEPSRGGALFPHLYGALDPALALWVKPLPMAADGTHQFPELDQ